MGKSLLMIFVVVFLFSLVSAGGLVQLCIDKTSPLAPADLGVTSSGSDIVLVWGAALDEPSCSGIDYYNVSRDGEWIGTVSGDVLTYNDLSVAYGTYSYSVFAVDLVGRNSGPAIKNDVVLSKPSNGGGGTRVRGGGSSSSYVCSENWECDEWSECIGDEQRRLCSDLNECGTKKDEPDVYQSCGNLEEDMVVENDLNGGAVSPVIRAFSAITGAVIGGGAASVAVAGGFLALVFGGFFVVIKKKKSEKKIGKKK